MNHDGTWPPGNISGLPTIGWTATFNVITPLYFSSGSGGAVAATSGTYVEMFDADIGSPSYSPTSPGYVNINGATGFYSGFQVSLQDPHELDKELVLASSSTQTNGEYGFAYDVTVTFNNGQTVTTGPLVDVYATANFNPSVGDTIQDAATNAIFNAALNAGVAVLGHNVELVRRSQYHLERTLLIGKPVQFPAPPAARRATTPSRFTPAQRLQSSIPTAMCRLSCSSRRTSDRGARAPPPATHCCLPPVVRSKSLHGFRIPRRSTHRWCSKVRMLFTRSIMIPRPHRHAELWRQHHRRHGRQHGSHTRRRQHRHQYHLRRNRRRQRKFTGALWKVALAIGSLLARTRTPAGPR